MKRNPKRCLPTNDHYTFEFSKPAAFTHSSPNFMENTTMLSSMPEPLIMQKLRVNPSMLLSHLNNLSCYKACDF